MPSCQHIKLLGGNILQIICSTTLNYFSYFSLFCPPGLHIVNSTELSPPAKKICEGESSDFPSLK